MTTDSNPPLTLSMLLSFPDQSASFTLGFEAGMLWQELEALPASVDRGMGSGFPVREENLPLIQRMAAARGYGLELGARADGWVPLRLTRGNSRPSLSLVEPDG